jgi:hypothetical protein
LGGDLKGDIKPFITFIVVATVTYEKNV